MKLDGVVVSVQMVAALLVGGLTVPAWAEQPPPAPVPVAERLSSIHIDNFGRINANYYRGAQPKQSDHADLAALGVRTVINLTRGDAQPNERALVELAGMQYVSIPMSSHVPPTADQVREFLRIVTDSAKQPVFVHCVAGRHRTGVMTAIYRMTRDLWTAEQAFAEMKRFKFGADFLHPKLKRFVFAFHPPPAPTAPAVMPAAAAPQVGRPH